MSSNTSKSNPSLLCPACISFFASNPKLTTCSRSSTIAFTMFSWFLPFLLLANSIIVSVQRETSAKRTSKSLMGVVSPRVSLQIWIPRMWFLMQATSERGESWQLKVALAAARPAASVAAVVVLGFVGWVGGVGGQAFSSPDSSDCA
ncbi:hypothetical protein HOY80DRAFT_945756 [Tuber brumale]|nr:hypothetical protein HOY80DRAFT_945756 [Tuber brumale]